MLVNSKSVTFSSNSVINGITVVTLYAHITPQGTCNQTVNIINSTLYEENKELVRKDIKEFNDLVYAQQDKTEDMED